MQFLGEDSAEGFNFCQEVDLINDYMIRIFLSINRGIQLMEDDLFLEFRQVDFLRLSSRNHAPDDKHTER